MPKARRDWDLILQYSNDGRWHAFFEPKQKLFPKERPR
jgi:hypothetical protein